MSTKKLERLEYLLQHEENFETTLSYFMDEFGADKAFSAAGRLVHVPVIIQILGNFCNHVLQKEKVALQDLHIILVERYRILHGYAFVDGNAVVFFYCKNINKGMFSMCNLFDRSKRVHYARMSPSSPKMADLFEDVFSGTEN